MRGQGCDGLVDMKLIFLLKRLLLPSGINDNDELMTMVVWCQMDIISVWYVLLCLVTHIEQIDLARVIIARIYLYCFNDTS